MLTPEQVQQRNVKILSGWEHIWTQNTAINFAMSKDGRGLGPEAAIQNLQMKHKATPALITGSGYSLLKTLDKLGGKFPGIVICTNSNLSACLAHGLRPDYCHVFDGKYMPERLKNVPIDGIPLISCTSVQPSFIEHWKKNGGPVYAFNMFDPNSVLFSKVIWFLYQFDAIPTSGSVAPNAIRLAAYMGCNPIVFAGMDFSFTEGNYRVKRYEHADGKWEPVPDPVQIDINKQPICYENGCPTWKITGILYKTALVNIVQQIQKEGMSYARLMRTNIRSKHVLKGLVMAETKGTRFLNATEGGIWKGEVEKIKIEDFIGAR